MIYILPEDRDEMNGNVLYGNEKERCDLEQRNECLLLLDPAVHERRKHKYQRDK
jgi:hypothetical protein